MSEIKDPVRVGLVGLRFGAGMTQMQVLNGGWGGKYIKIVAACDLVKEKVEEFSAQYSLEAYTSMDEMLENSDIEGVMLMTPPAGRAQLIRKCLDAGKHIFTTKPFELDPDAAAGVLQLAKERNLIIHLNSPAPLPACDLAQIRAWQAKYDLGRAVAANWETYASYNEVANDSWLDSFDKCPAAPIFRIGIYGINELNAIFEEDVEDVEVVTGHIRTGRPTPDNAQLIIRYRSGAIGSIFASLCIGDGTLYPSALKLHFENGTIWKQQTRMLTDKAFTSVDMSLRAVIDGQIVEESVSLPPEKRSGGYQFDNFYNAVRNGAAADEIAPEIIVAGVKVISEMAKKEKRK